MIPEADDVLKDIIRDIVAQANERAKTENNSNRQSPKRQISETLAAFVLRALVIHPDEGIDMTKELSQDEVKALIQVRQ